MFNLTQLIVPVWRK